MKSVFLMCLTILYGCGAKEQLPDERSTSGVTMSGSADVPIAGTTDEIYTIALPTSAPAALPPISLSGGGFAVVDEGGRLYFYDRIDSLRNSIALTIPQPELLLSRGQEVIALSHDGSIESLRIDGTLGWSAKVSGEGNLTAVLNGNRLFIAKGRVLTILDAGSGKELGRVEGGLAFHALASSDSSILALLSANRFDATDSLVEFSVEGVRKNSFPLAGERAVSNLAVTENGLTALGAIGSTGAEGRKRDILLFDKDLKLLWRHALNFTPSRIAAASGKILASGVDYRQSDAAGYLAEFRTEDTLTQWRRTFSFPLATMPVISADNIYFAVSFTSEAVVSTRGLFFTLNAENGKTISERAVPGAVTGFLPGPAMPDDRGRLLVAAQGRNVIYVFDRSSYQRVF